MISFWITEVGESKYYTIRAGVATECSLKQQIALIYRFVAKRSTSREEFSSFLECSCDLGSLSLFQTIKEFKYISFLDSTKLKIVWIKITTARFKHTYYDLFQVN